MLPRILLAPRSGLVLAGLLALACNSGGGGGDGSSAATTGSVGILVTDAPNAEFDRVDVTVSKIELLGEPGTVVIFSGLETFDLLALETYSSLFAIAEDVPVGAYEKVRLTLTDLALVRVTDDGMGGTTEEEIRPKLPGNGKLDLNPREPFFVVPGDLLMLEVDIDAKKSVHYVETGNGKWVFRPVAFVRVVDGVRDMEKLARVHGDIREFIDPDGFVLCSPQIRAEDLDSDSDSDGQSDPSCITVFLFSDSAVFDESGDSALVSDLTVGDPVTVVGNLRIVRGTDSDADSDSDSAVQTAASPAEDSDRDDSDSDSDFDLDEAGIQLDAVVIEQGPLGTFPRLRGVVATAVGPDDRFDFDVDPGQGQPDPTVLPTQLQEGTAVLSKSGFRLPDSQIQPGVPAQVDGVLDPSAESPALIKAALVLLGVPVESLASLEGEIVNLDAPARELDLVTASGTECVEVASDAFVLEITDTGSIATSEVVTLADLASGQTAMVFGTAGTSCFEAEAVVAEN